MGYLKHGRQESEFLFIVSGLLLAVYPYFFESVYWIFAIGIVLLALPFFPTYVLPYLIHDEEEMEVVVVAPRSSPEKKSSQIPGQASAQPPSSLDSSFNRD